MVVCFGSHLHHAARRRRAHAPLHFRRLCTVSSRLLSEPYRLLPITRSNGNVIHNLPRTHSKSNASTRA